MTRARLALLCAAAFGWAFSFGVGAQAVSHWLKGLGHCDATIGLIHAMYYVGVAGAALLVPRVNARFGRACPLAGMLVSSLALAAFPWFEQPFSWCVLRLVSGAGCAFTLIPLEALIGKTSTPDQRTQNFSYYAVALTLGGALGIALGLSVYEQGRPTVFYLGTLAPLCAMGFLAWSFDGAPLPEEAKDQGPIPWRRHYLSFGTAWSQGFLEGGMLAFLALYLEWRGLSRETAGLLMGVTMAGVIAFQIPVAWLGDRLSRGRTPVLVACYLMVMASLIVVPCCESLVWTGAWLFLFGAFSAAMYPLGLALLGERTPARQLPRVYAVYMAMECVGSQFGAAAMGKARDLWGEASMFTVGLAAVASVLGSWWLLARRRTELVVEEKRDAIRTAA